MRRIVAVITSALVLVGLLAVAPAGAVGGAANVSVFHGIPGLTVDVYVDGNRVLDDFTPGTVAGPLPLAAGTHEVSITAADATDDSSPVLGPVGVTVAAGGDYTIAAHLDESGSPTAAAFLNDTSAIDAGNGRVTVRHLAAAPAVDVDVVGVGDAFTDVANGQSAAADLPAATYEVSLEAAGTETQVFPESGTVPVPLADGTNLVVYAYGTLGADFALATQAISAPIGAPATVSVVHGVPGLTVDVYTNGLLLLEDFEPGVVAGPVLLPAGTYDIDIFPAGSEYVPGDGAIFVDDLAVPAGLHASIVAHLDDVGSPTASVFVDSDATVATGEARLTVRHTAAADSVDITTGDTVLVDAIENGESESLDVPAGDYPVTINVDDGAAVADLGTVTLAEGIDTIVYAIGTPPAVDAIAPANGAGGTFTIVVDTIPGLAAAGPMSDVPAAAYYADAVRALLDLGVTNGVTADTYAPAQPMTRGMMAAFINRALGLAPSAVDAFTDDDGSVFEDDINAVAAAGITSGLTATTFGPDLQINRAQLAAFVDRAFNLPSSSVDAFTDDDGLTLESSIDNAAAAGVVLGTSATTYSPGAGANRAEVAAIFARALGVA